MITQLHNHFALKDLGPVHYFLGIQVTRNTYGFIPTQTKYAQDLLKKFSMDKSAACPTPMVAHRTLSASKGESLENPSMYRSVVGALQYLTHTILDLSFTVNKFSQFLQAPTTTHWKALKRVFRYLQGTLQLGIQIKSSTSLHIAGFSDADWATSMEDQKSVGVVNVFFG